MANTYTFISSTTLSSSQSTVTFSSIPNTYTDLLVRWSARSDRASAASDGIILRLNSDSGTNYSYTRLISSGTSLASARNTVNYIQAGNINASTSSANTFGSGEIYIPVYTSTSIKPMSTFNVYEDNVTNPIYIGVVAHLWQGTAAVNRIDIQASTPPSVNNLVSGSSFYLYGIKNS